MEAGHGEGRGMATIDGWLEGFLHGPTALWVVLLISLLLGLRHASDPDHLAAVTTLIASEKDGSGLRKAGSMGFSWGLGHGTSLVLIGLPLVLLGRYLPGPVQQAAETLIGGIIIFLAVRLLVRWRRGHFHAHVHSHDGEPFTATSTRTNPIPRTSTPIRSRCARRSLPMVSGWCMGSAGPAGLRCCCSRPYPNAAQATGRS